MPKIRRHLHHLAAFMLLVWLFVAGAVMASVCVSHVHMEDAHGCCVSMQAATLPADTLAEAVTPAPATQPWRTGAPPLRVIAPPALDAVRRPFSPHWNDSGQRIHLLLQRFAL